MADPAQVPGGGGEGSLETKPTENPSQAKPAEEVKVQEPVIEQPKQETKEEKKSDADTKQEESKSTEITPDAPKVDEIQIPVLPVEESPKIDGAQPTESVPVTAAVVEEIKPTTAPVSAAIPKEDAKPAESVPNGVPKEEESKPQSEDWQQREQELLKKIEELEKVKNERSEDGLRLELKVREEEIDLLKARVKNLETELQAALSKPGGKNQELIDKIKQQHEELLSKAKGMIFDKTKMVKNQELQIEALTTQIASLKDINQITKDLLEIRNSEVKAMEDRFEAMESRFKAEKERYDLVLKRAQTSNNINDDLRKEYETQLSIFKELREKYELRVQALVAENNRLKESVQGPSV